MDKRKMMEIAGLYEDFNPRAASRILKSIEDSMVSLQDEFYSMEGEERQMALDSLKQMSAGLSTMKQMLRKYTSF